MQGGVKVSGDDRALLMSKFAAPPSGDQDDDDEGEERKGEDAEARGETSSQSSSLSSSPSSSAAMDYDAFVRWLSEGGGLDDALLRKVQRHLKARLSK